MTWNCISVLAALLTSAIAIGPVASAGPHPGALTGNLHNGLAVRSQRVRPDTAHPNYEWIDVRIEGGHWVSLWGINDSRVASGAYIDDQGGTHSFWWANGQIFQVPDYPGALHTSVSTIDNLGRLFGNWGSEEVQHAGYYDLATHRWTPLPDIPGYPINIGARMTESGRATGWACYGTFSNSFSCTGWVWTGEGYEMLGTESAFPFGISNSGEVVGYDSALRGFVYNKGVRHDLLDVNGEQLVALVFSVNNQGAILVNGGFEPTNSNWVPAILYKGSQTVLPRPSVLATFYQGMNERGDLVGLWYDDPAFTDFFGLIAFRK